MKPNYNVCSLLLGMLFLSFLCACSTTKSKETSAQKQSESIKNQKSALMAVVGSISDKELSEKDLKKIVKDLKNDEEAQSAINSIKDSLGRDQVKVKYCPITGKRYAPRIRQCPEHGVDLEWVE